MGTTHAVFTALTKSPATSSELLEATGLPRNEVFASVRELVDGGVVKLSPDGRWMALAASTDTCFRRIDNPTFRDVLGAIADWSLTLPHDPTVGQEDGPDYCLGCEVGQTAQMLAIAITDAEKAYRP